MKRNTVIDPTVLGDDALFAILWDEEDRVPLAVIREILARHERFIDRLITIIGDTHVWEHDADEWIPRHATFILGAIGGNEVVQPLLMSLRRAAWYNDDWILDELPSIFGSIGEPAYQPLQAMVMDRSNDWEVRTTALDSLASITIKNPTHERAVFDLAARIMNDRFEDRALRGLAGNVLLDFGQKTYEKSLRSFAEEGRLRQERDPTDISDFDESEINDTLRGGRGRLDHYTHDGLHFYSPEALVVREANRRRDREWWWRKFFWWFEKRKFLREVDQKIADDISRNDSRE